MIMKKSEIIFDQLNKLGFEPIKLGDDNFIFSYEQLPLLYMGDEGDENFLRFAVPQMFDVTDENRGVVLEAISEVAEVLKYSKVCIMYGNSVWAFYEHCLLSYDNLSELLEHIIYVLGNTMTTFMRRMNGENIHPSLDNDDKNFDDIIDDEFKKLEE